MEDIILEKTVVVDHWSGRSPVELQERLFLGLPYNAGDVGSQKKVKLDFLHPGHKRLN